MPTAHEWVEMFKSKSWPHTLVMLIGVAVSTFFLTLKFAEEVHKVEKMLDARFAKIDQRFAQMQTQVDLAWTIHMQRIRDNYVARNNPTNIIPDAFEIYDAVRGGRKPEPIRIQ